MGRGKMERNVAFALALLLELFPSLLLMLVCSIAKTSVL